jgi:DHA1 family bicyclomycin/chloramphenicol resistance-like MFS transporter
VNLVNAAGHRQLEVPRSSAGIILLVGSMSALGAIAGDIYLPTLPQIALDFHTSDGGAQQTIAFTMLGGAVGQLTVGPISDYFGRRIPVLVGLILHVLASIGIIFCPSIALLLGLRFIQGIGNASAGVVSLAVVRDLYSGAKAARLLSQLMLVVGVGPLFAPTLGTFIAQAGGWRSTFAFLGLVGALLWIFVFLKLPDTRPEEGRQGTGVLSAFKGYGKLFTDLRFLAFALIPGLAGSAMMAWVSNSPFLLMETYGLGEFQFPVVFALGGMCMVAGAQVNAHLVQKHKPRILLQIALTTTWVLSVILTIVSALNVGGLAGMLVPLFAILFANGMGPANASALAMSRHGEVAGAAAALVGTTQVGIQALVILVMSSVTSGQLGMAMTILVTMSTAFALFFAGTLLARRSR